MGQKRWFVVNQSYSTMRLLFSLILIGSLTACTRSTAGLTIPAGQMFVLGEYMEVGYRASITNRGERAVTVALVRKSDGRLVRTLQLAPEAAERVTVSADQRVEMTNRGAADAELLVQMSRGVEGMRLQSLEGSSSRQTTLRGGARDREDVSNRFSATVAPGSCYVIGDGTEPSYEATVRARGEQVDLRVVNSDSEEWVRGFGLGAGSKETVGVGEGEVLYLCNDRSAKLTVAVRTNRPVSDGRIVEAAN